MISSIKKFLSISFVMILSAALLVGCGTNTNKSSNSSATAGSASTGSASTAKAPTKPVHIEFWYGLGGKLGDNVKKEIQAFNSSQSQVVVTGVQQGNYTETYQKLQAAIAAGNPPAVVLLTGDTTNALASKKVLAPLDSYIKKDSSFNPSDFVKAFYGEGTVNGIQYALPAYGTTQVMYYRKDLFKQAGVSPDALNTFGGLAKAAKKLTQKSGGKVSVYGWEPMWGSGNLIDAALSNGGQFLSKDGKKVTIDTPAWVNSWKFFGDAIFKDKTMAIHHGGQGWEYWYKTIDDVMHGQAAGYTGSSGDQGDLDFSKIAAHVQPGWNGNAPHPEAGAQMMSIPASVSPEKQAAAFKWVQFFTSSKMTAQWSMNTGYIAVRKSAQDDPAFKTFAKKNPQILVPLKQAQTASAPFIDPTGGKITDALSKAADKVEIQGIPASTALKQAQVEAQRALDQTLKSK